MNEVELDTAKLSKIAKALVVDSKGILAADESTGTIKKRLDSIGVESTEETRRSYRELLFTAPGIEQHISGVIMFEETLKQSTKNGNPFPKLLEERGIIPGIKVDAGKKPFHNSPNEMETQGLQDLKERLPGYIALGAKFAKWRAVVKIDKGIPTHEAMAMNANHLGRYAYLCQEAGVVPIIEPEVLMDGDHDIARCEEVTLEIQKLVFDELKSYKVFMGGILLKPNMVISGIKSKVQASADEVARATLRTLAKNVPDEVPGIVFLSGGQSAAVATENLRAINKLKGDAPWKLSFSYGRALQASVLKTWKGISDNREIAQKALLEMARNDSSAIAGGV